MKSLDGKVFKNGIKKKLIDAYSFTEFQRMLDEIIKSGNIEFIIFDISCITKIHTLALAASLSLYNQRFRCAMAYSVPENYNHRLSDTRKAPGWRDIIIAPLAETALLFNESSSRGIIIPGHEADRLIVALAEIEPSGGSILIAETPKRPDFRYATNKLNSKIFRQLTRMSSRSWEKTIIATTRLDLLRKYIEKEIMKAKGSEAPIIYFPYGPKLLIFLGAFQLSIEYPEASWFVYPIPTSYDVNYTEGIQETMWLLFN